METAMAYLKVPFQHSRGDNDEHHWKLQLRYEVTWPTLEPGTFRILQPWNAAATPTCLVRRMHYGTRKYSLSSNNIVTFTKNCTYNLQSEEANYPEFETDKICGLHFVLRCEHHYNGHRKDSVKNNSL